MLAGKVRVLVSWVQASVSAILRYLHAKGYYSPVTICAENWQPHVDFTVPL